MIHAIPHLQCHILDTGYCLAWEHHLIQGGQHRRVACHSLVALLCHPRHGWLLWDTGYAPRMFEVTQHFPFSLYRRATPLYISPELSVASQLPRWQLQPADIQHVIISHFHADHIAGLLDFPSARFIVSHSAYNAVASRRGLRALARAFIPALLPSDFEHRTTFLPPFTASSLPSPGATNNLFVQKLATTMFTASSLPSSGATYDLFGAGSLGTTHDLFGDGSLLLLSLPGHAHGQLGMLIHTTRGRILFAADSCWLRRSIYELRPPSRLTNFFIDDPRALRATLNRLHIFSQTCSDVTIIPSHCPEAYTQEIEQNHPNPENELKQNQSYTENTFEQNQFSSEMTFKPDQPAAKSKFEQGQPISESELHQSQSNPKNELKQNQLGIESELHHDH